MHRFYCELIKTVFKYSLVVICIVGLLHRCTIIKTVSSNEECISSVSFVSEAWGGRTSNKFRSENCGMLYKLLPGDTFVADRGFTISESMVLG